MAGDLDITRMSETIAREAPSRDAGARRERELLAVSGVLHDGPYVRIRLDAPDAWRQLHKHPGQYITAQFGDSRHRFLVLASAPFETRAHGYELLVEPNQDLAPTLDGLTPGDLVLASAPEGIGFPAVEADRAHLFATGSGIAALRPVLSEWNEFREQAPRQVVLYYEEDGDHPHAFRDELDAWSAQPWLVVRRFSRDSVDTEYLHERFDTATINPDDDVLVCGSPAMIASVSARLLAAGFSGDRIRTNI